MISQNDYMAIGLQMEKPKASESYKLIDFDRKHLILIGLLFFIFVLSVTLKIHGYSISMWHAYIDGSKAEEIIVGKPQPVRSDDWAVEIPLMLSQINHDPPFPMVNQNIGNGSNMLTHSKNPIWHYLTFFRPTVWGFFIGADYGLSWMWQTMVLGMFYVFFLVIMMISKNDFLMSVSGSLFLLFSPFFQFWSFHKAEIPIFMGLIFISFSYIWFAQRRMTIIVHAFILGWALSCYTINFVYPPFQISCAYLLLFLIVGFFYQYYKDSGTKKFLIYRISGSIVAIFIFGCVAYSYFYAAKDIINIMMDTVYPGNRFFTGGDCSIGVLFRQHFLSLLFFSSLSNIDWGPLGNSCEASSFLFFFVPVIIALLWQVVRNKGEKHKLSVSLIGYFVLMLVYFFYGFSPSLSKFSLFYQMQSGRAIIGVGIANVLLIISFLTNAAPLNKIERAVISVCWGSILLFSARAIVNAMNLISIPYVVVVSIVSSVIAYYLLDIKHKKKVMVVFAGLSILSTVWINPVVSGGTKFIYENPLSEKIIDIDRSLDGQSVWATFGFWVYPNLFRMLGVKSINGTYPYPQLELWEQFDTTHQFMNEYNRFAHATLKGIETNEIQFHSPTPDQLYISFNPASEVSDLFGITHFLVTGEEEIYFKNNLRFQKIFTFHDKTIYALNPIEKG